MTRSMMHLDAAPARQAEGACFSLMTRGFSIITGSAAHAAVQQFSPMLFVPYFVVHSLRRHQGGMSISGDAYMHAHAL